MNHQAIHLLGVDTGGTFTDFVHYDGRTLRVHKVLSTPASPEAAILQGVRELGLDTQGLRVIHGSTVATNAALEGKGVRTVLVTNRGFGDLLTIGRQAREELYDLQPPPREPPVPEALCLETGGRLGADGRVVDALTAEDLSSLRAALERLAPRSVAVNLLFSFLDGRFERQVASAVPAGVFVSCSSTVLPEAGEYERGVATWLNAWIGPLMEGYVGRLAAGLRPARVAVMQSSGETADAAAAGERAVHLLLSGPAGGLAGVGYAGRLAGETRLLSFDMGGTSTDVALVEGAPRLTTEGRIGPYPVAVPMVDMHTIGAGGGSIAWIDPGGMLRVGPQSAGAEPGPACYGAGGRDATVTDANLVLGRLLPDAFLGGAMTLDPAAAREALVRLGGALGVTAEEAARGVIAVANENMARALRVISVGRGVDPRGMALACFGGAGGLHVCALAEALGMGRALVPFHGGVLSALGMLVAPAGRQLVRALPALVGEADPDAVEGAFRELEDEGTSALAAEGLTPGELHSERSLDLRYRGQSYTLNLPWEGSLDDVEGRFHGAHRERYGHAMDVAVELVNVRVALKGPPALSAGLPRGRGSGAPARGETRLDGVAEPVPVWEREALVAGRPVSGPAVLVEAVATTYVAPGWSAVVDEWGNLRLNK